MPNSTPPAEGTRERMSSSGTAWQQELVDTLKTVTTEVQKGPLFANCKTREQIEWRAKYGLAAEHYALLLRCLEAIEAAEEAMQCQN